MLNTKLFLYFKAILFFVCFSFLSSCSHTTQQASFYDSLGISSFNLLEQDEKSQQNSIKVCKDQVFKLIKTNYEKIKNDPQYYSNRSLCFYLTGDYQRSFNDLIHANDLSKKSLLRKSAYWNNLAVLSFVTNNYKTAQGQLEKAFNLNKNDDPSLLINRIFLNYHQENYSKVISDMQYFLKNKKPLEHIDLINIYAFSLFQIKSYKKLYSFISEYENRLKDSKELFYLSLKIYFEQKNWSKIRDLSQIEDDLPKNWPAIIKIALLNLEKENQEKQESP